MFIKKYSDGNWYLCRRTSRKSQGKPSLTNWFWIKCKDNGSDGKYIYGYINTRSITFPKEFIGKKIRLKVEVLK